MDIRYLGKGSTLYLPVKVPGGLLQMGDCHAAQGNSGTRTLGLGRWVHRASRAQAA